MNKIITFCLLLCFIGCTKKEDSPESPVDSIQIRLQNTSEFTLKNALLNTGGGENNYGDIAPNSFSDYKRPFPSFFSPSKRRLFSSTPSSLSIQSAVGSWTKLMLISKFRV